jgi:thiol-disulfide isomerase/thioredoxin
MKMNNWKRSIMTLSAICFASYIFGQAAAVTLKIGDPAPELKVTWLKGTPVTSLDKDKLYVLEFWATWCGPCKLAMPHLSELAKQYTGKVTFIGIDIWEKGSEKKLYETFRPELTEFVAGMGDKMAYNVAMDNNDLHMSNNWMKAAGQYGIPSTFLLKGGKIIWIGHPIKLDTILLKVFDGTYNMESYAKEFNQKNTKSLESVAPLLALQKEVTDAIAAKDFSNAMNAIENGLINIDSTFRISVLSLKFTTLLEYDVPAALAFARELCRDIPSGKGFIGQTIVTKDGLPKEAYQLAADYFTELLALPGVPVPMIHDYVAKCYFKMNDISNAISFEEKAVQLGAEAIESGKYEGTINKGSIKEYQETLAKYKAAQK